MLVGPGGVSSGLMNHAEDGVSANEVPRINRSATILRITVEFRRINGGDSAVGQARTGCAAVQLCLIDINAFIEFSGIPSGSRVRCTRCSSHSVSSGVLRAVERTVISHVVIDA